MTANNGNIKQNRINIDAALGILAPTGPFSLSFKGFEARKEQQLMMGNILEAYNQDQIALIEAGTGTGKSLAYLIPAILWALETKERTVISTNTITLQEQLLHKDIPLIEKTLNTTIKTVLVKGMQNYLCLRKLSEMQQESLLLTPQENEELDKISAWSGSTSDGSRSSLPLAPSQNLWERLSAESDTCNRTQCHYYQQCHFFKARRQASEAQVLIVNHHLLFADLVYRAENDQAKDAGILPNYNRIIIDEAHNIEDIATEYFASHISQLDIMRLMARLASEKGGKVNGKLPLLKEKIISHYRNNFSPKVSSIQNRLTIDLPGMRRDLLQHTHEAFKLFAEFSKLAHETEQNSPTENKLRIYPHHQEHVRWTQQLMPSAKQLNDSIQRYAQGLKAIIEDIKQLNDNALDEQIKGILFEINALANRLGQYATAISRFTLEPTPVNTVRWIESQPLKLMVNTSLVDAELNITKTLAECLFNKFSTIILCSATLTTDKHFNFIRKQLGLTKEILGDRKIKEYTYDSPFNFIEQAMLAIPNDLPNPNDPSFIKNAAERIWQALLASHGNAFVLFTSHSMLKTCFELLEQRLKDNLYHPLKQGDDDRLALLNKFKKTNRSVLFGTDSFWEGIDVTGDALRCVIIVKLPFKVPTDPLMQARSEAITARGGDPFMEYSLPQAIVKFKQGFGRLIRNQRDRGCIICLDNRITTKKYGQFFLNSLPKCQQVFIPSNNLKSCMEDFYRRTHFLTKKMS